MSRIFFFTFYTIFIGILYILSIPILILISNIKLKYRESIKARFFLKDNPPLRAGGVWFHTCSYGEARAVFPIMDRLPKSILRATTTTETGYRAISEKIPNSSRYLPFEPLLLYWIRNQKVLVVAEAELWYLLFLIAKRRGAKSILINARISSRSFPKYRMFHWLYRRVFENIDEVYAQTDIDRDRLKILGAKNIEVIGNIKLFDIPKPTRELSKPKKLLICAGSTHEGEERVVLEAFIKFHRVYGRGRLVIAPRHPERFDSVLKLVEEVAGENHLSWHRFSENEAFNSDIVVVDMLGELINIYAISDIVVLGGAFEPHGGHNFAEPAQFEIPIISGEYYFNQIDIFNMVDGVEITPKEGLAEKLLGYESLKRAKIIKRTDIEPILKSIEGELSYGKGL
ncbi:MAG: 3-deoxy-D-manno-octulosonic acid transferase [Epsilonproteobacteria bacterium]|nr:3-deoxy-D-manno-octulosonic acid transferase [Campylobacterota bacterium]